MINPDNRIVTVFGGSGFIGRYLCEDLFERELRVRVACRDPRTAHFIQMERHRAYRKQPTESASFDCMQG